MFIFILYFYSFYSLLSLTLSNYTFTIVNIYNY